MCRSASSSLCSMISTDLLIHLTLPESLQSVPATCSGNPASLSKSIVQASSMVVIELDDDRVGTRNSSMAGEIPRQEEGVRRLLWLGEAGVVKYLQVRVIAKYVVTTSTGTMIRRAMMKRTRAAMRSPSEGGGWLGACGQKSIDMPVQTSVVVGYRDIDKGRGEREEDLGRRPGCRLARYAFLYQRKCNASMCRKGRPAHMVSDAPYRA